MKRVLILSFSLFVAAATAFANGEGDKRGGGDQMARMQEHLGLSNEQMEQIREIRQNGGGRDEIRAVFTDEQRALMDERRSQMQGRGGKEGHHGQGRPPGRADQPAREPQPDQPADDE